jgi:hypothetical protein
MAHYSCDAARRAGLPWRIGAVDRRTNDAPVIDLGHIRARYFEGRWCEWVFDLFVGLPIALIAMAATVVVAPWVLFRELVWKRVTEKRASKTTHDDH